MTVRSVIGKEGQLVTREQGGHVFIEIDPDYQATGVETTDDGEVTLGRVYLPFHNAAKDVRTSVLASGNASISPEGIAADADGDLLVVDSNDQAVWAFRNGARLPSKDISTNELRKANPTYFAGTGIVVDADGDVLIADRISNAVWAFRLGVRYSTKDIPASELAKANISPAGLAVDLDGDVLVLHSGDVVRGFQNGARLPEKDIARAVVQSANPSIAPTGLAVDLDGDVLILDSNTDAVWAFSAGERASMKDIPAEVVKSVSSTIVPSGITVDGDGDVLVLDSNSDAVWGYTLYRPVIP